MDQERQQGLLAILIANTIFGLNIPVTKALMAQWMTPMGYTMTRMFFGTVIFWMIGTFLRKDKVAPRDLMVMMIGGLIGIFGHTIFVFPIPEIHHTGDFLPADGADTGGGAFTFVSIIEGSHSLAENRWDTDQHLRGKHDHLAQWGKWRNG